MAIKTFHRFGSISTGTLLARDLLPAFYDEARERFVRFGDLKGKVPEPIIAASRILDVCELLDGDSTLIDQIYESEIVGEIVDDLSDLLDSDLPPFIEFGNHPGDGADFGYWFDSDSFEESVHGRETVKVDELPEHPKAFAKAHPNCEYLAVITDHGNVSLYSMWYLWHGGARRAEYYSIV